MNNQNTLNKFYDKDFRKKIIKDPQSITELLNYKDVEALEFVIKKNTKEVMYIAVPFASHESIDDLQNIQAAGNTASTAGTAASGSTASSISSTVSSASSASSAGSIGSVAS